jgi:phospholipase C
MCGNGTTTALGGPNADHVQGRCGYGPRLPLLVISPYAKRNYVDHTTTDQSSITRFIEDNWLGGERIQGSFDALAGTLNGMFDFKDESNRGVFLLDQNTGLVLFDQSGHGFGGGFGHDGGW